MALQINEKQFNAVVALPAKERYGHFIKCVADSEEAWGLRSEGGWSLAGDDENQEAFPLWPHPRYDEACAIGDWADAHPEKIPLDELIEFLSKLEADRVHVAVFPTPAGKGIVVTPGELRSHLEEELKNYE